MEPRMPAARLPVVVWSALCALLLALLSWGHTALAQPVGRHKCPPGTKPASLGGGEGRGEQFCLKGGKKNGPSWTWHNPGQLAVRATYRADKRHGPFVAWQPDGRELVEGAYRDDAPHGHWAEWYANGQKRREGQYDRGKERGRWRYWTQSGAEQAQACDPAKLEKGASSFFGLAPDIRAVHALRAVAEACEPGLPQPMIHLAYAVAGLDHSMKSTFVARAITELPGEWQSACKGGAVRLTLKRGDSRHIDVRVKPSTECGL